MLLVDPLNQEKIVSLQAKVLITGGKRSKEVAGLTYIIVYLCLLVDL